MKDDDDDLGIDLDAWQPPPVPGGIADAVVAQMRQEHTSVTTVTPVEPERRGSKRIWLVAIPLVAAAAAAGIVSFGIRRAPASGQGTVVAERPMHLSLGPSAAELDRSTQVTWQRDRYHITATQHGGAATWRVDDDDTLTIDAALASIEATNASMRVEVKMIDAEQKRTIATSAVTAAAVALVAIVVYEGTIKVTDAEGNTRKVGAGTTYEIKGPNTVIEEEATVGASPDRIAEIEELDRQIAEKRKELEDLKKQGEWRTVDKDDIVEKLDSSTTRESLDRNEIERVMTSLKPKLQACANGFNGTVKVAVRVSPSGAVTSVDTRPADAAPATCIGGVIRTALFAKARQATSFSYPLLFKAPVAPAATCDFDALFAQGQAAYSNNEWARALGAFEAAYQCRADNQALKLTFAAACGIKNVAKARVYWAKLDQPQKDQVLQICIRNGIDRDQLEQAADRGTLRVIGPKSSTIFIDGKRIGGNSVEVEITPGKHKVTIEVGDEKHSFSVLVKAGESVSLDKQSL